MDALAWYDEGIVPLPVRKGTKQATVKWKRWQTEKPSRAMVERWFSSGDHNVGLLTGPVSGGLVILDFDVIPTYFNWRHMHKYYLAASYTVRTARGFHVYLYSDTPVDKTFALDGVDVKTTGYVLTPPSVHPSGVLYETVLDESILRVVKLDTAVVGLTGGPNKPNIRESQSTGVTVNVYGDNATVVNNPYIRLFGLLADLSNVRLPHDVVRRIKERLTILDVASWYTEMRSSDAGGNWYIGRCPHPEHEDRHPSFTLSLRNGRANCKTPGCALHTRHGLDVIDLVGRMQDVRPRDAMALLAVRLGLVDEPVKQAVTGG